MSSLDVSSNGITESLGLNSDYLENFDSSNILMRIEVFYLVLEDLYWLKLILETANLCRYTHVYHQAVMEDYFFMAISTKVSPVGDWDILDLPSGSSFQQCMRSHDSWRWIIIQYERRFLIYTDENGEVFSLSSGSGSITRGS